MDKQTVWSPAYFGVNFMLTAGNFSAPPPPPPAGGTPAAQAANINDYFYLKVAA